MSEPVLDTSIEVCITSMWLYITESADTWLRVPLKTGVDSARPWVFFLDYRRGIVKRNPVLVGLCRRYRAIQMDLPELAPPMLFRVAGNRCYLEFGRSSLSDTEKQACLKDWMDAVTQEMATASQPVE